MTDKQECNRCILKRIERAAAAEGLRVEIKGDRYGVTVLTHPPDDKPFEEEDFVAWFMELPPECACGSATEHVRARIPNNPEVS